MEPLRIEWRINGVWSPPARGLHLDGLVARAVVEEELAARVGGASATDAGPVDYDKIINANLPSIFERFDGDSDWCWKASMLQPVGKTGMSRRYLTNKTPVDAAARAIADGWVSKPGQAIIDTVRGHAKNAAITYPLEHITGLVAWAIGDAEALRQLLGRFDGIGYKQVRGHGTVIPFEDGSMVRVTPDTEALEKWKFRNLPQPLIERSVPARCALRAPYWRNVSMGWVPVPA